MIVCQACGAHLMETATVCWNCKAAVEDDVSPQSTPQEEPKAVVQEETSFNMTRCPHCGMIDYRHSSQGIHNTHWPSCKVGGVTKYECGKCRKSFFSLEIQVPLDMEPMAVHKKINSMFTQEAAG